jgi:hypothetical protein
MILMVIVGVYALVAAKIRFTRSFQLTGKSARRYGVALIALAIPATLAVNIVVRPLLPSIVLSNRAILAVVNVLFIGTIMLGLAALFRDREPVMTKPPTASSDLQQPPY